MIRFSVRGGYLLLVPQGRALISFLRNNKMFKNTATLLFNYMNNQHPNIRFTMEQETDHVLPFLDVLINKTDPHQSVTTVYRKKIFTGLLTSYLSFCPFTYKLGLIKTLIQRTFKTNNT